MSEDYWEGRTWVYHADILNDETNSGTHSYEVSPGRGNELEVLYGRLLNLDSTARTVNANVDDDAGNQIGHMIPTNFSLTQAQRIGFPVIDEANSNAAVNSNRWFLSGAMTLQVEIASIAVSQDTVFSISCRIRGGLPTVTLTSPTGATETVNRNQVY